MTEAPAAGLVPAPGPALTAGLVLTAGLALGWVGCAVPGTGEPGGSSGDVERIPPDATPVEVRPVADFPNSGIHVARREEVRSAGRWERVWEELVAGRAPTPAPPHVDFRERMVLVATMGERPSGGYEIAIERVLRTSGDRLLAVVRETSPGEGCVVTQALTAPAVAVSVPRVRGDVSFLEREETRDC